MYINHKDIVKYKDKHTSSNSSDDEHLMND